MKPKVLIWYDTEWAIGRVYTAVVKYMSHWYDFEYISWKSRINAVELWKSDNHKKYDIILSGSAITWYLTENDLLTKEEFECIQSKIISTAHSCNFNVEHFFEKFIKYERVLYSGISVETLKNVKNNYNIDALLTPTGVDCDLFYPTRVITNVKKIGFVGNPDSFPSWHAIKRTDMFMKICEKANVEPIFIHGKNPDLNLKLYDDIDMLIYCSIFEGAGQGILEAGACKIPVITTHVGYAQYFKNIKTFYTIDQAVDIIQKFNEDPDSLVEYAEKLGNEIKSEWNWSVICEKYWKPAFEKRLNTGFSFVEIGTSDFDYNQTSEKGLFVEPIKEYYDRIDIGTFSKKINSAITYQKTQDTCNVFYIPSVDIEKNNLPNWLRGCNSIHDYHLQHEKYKHLVETYSVPLINIGDLIEEYNLINLDYLKIDTEGHDYVIMEGVFEYFKDKHSSTFPKKIIFETNILTSEDNSNYILEKFKFLGYTNVTKVGDETMIYFCNPDNKPLITDS